MQPINIAETSYTPGVNFDLNGQLLLRGTSCAEHTEAFYANLIQWLNDYHNRLNNDEDLRDEVEEVVFTLNLFYFNSASAKQIILMLKVVKEMIFDDIPVKVYWYYDVEDDQLLEDGEDLSQAINVPFIFCPVEEA